MPAFAFPAAACGLDVTNGVVWYQIGQGSPRVEEKENSVSKTTKKTRKTTSLYFP